MAQGTTRSGVCAYGMALQRGLSEVANLRVMPGRPHHAPKRDAAPGIDGVTWQVYGEIVEGRLAGRALRYPLLS